MSRAAFLSAGGDPFLADFTLKLWNERWRDEIDTMYVAYNNHAETPKEVAHEFLHKWENDPKVRLIYTPHGIGNGNPITQMLFNSHEDALLLLEDDSFIFTPGIVNEWFNLISEQGLGSDIIGSPRYTVGEIADNAKRVYNLDYSGIGDHGFGWWPSFFVCRRNDLLKTDLDFGSKEYPSGTYFKEIDHTMEKTEYTDTFTWTSLQLRHMGLVSHDIPQNHAHPFDLENMKNKSIMFQNGDPKYIHGGSLSSGWGGYLNKKIPPLSTEMEIQDIQTRLAFWDIITANGIYDERFHDFRRIYRTELETLRNHVEQGNQKRMETYEEKINLYRSIMGV